MDIKQMRAAKKNELEAEYLKCITESDSEGACKIVGTLISYHLIEKNDDRIQKNSELFRKYKAEMERYTERFKTAPDWIVIRLPNSMRSEMVMEQHHGKRVEGVYTGDVIFPKRQINLVMRNLTGMRAIQNELEDFEKNYSTSIKKQKLTRDYIEAFESGEKALYKIEVESGVSFRTPHIGAVVISYKQNEQLVQAAILLNHEVLKSNYILIKPTYQRLRTDINKVISKLCGAYSLKVVSFIAPSSLDEVTNKQKQDSNYIFED